MQNKVMKAIKRMTIKGMTEKLDHIIARDKLLSKDHTVKHKKMDQATKAQLNMLERGSLKDFTSLMQKLVHMVAIE